MKLLIVFDRAHREIAHRKQYGDEPHESGRAISDRLVAEEQYGPEYEVIVVGGSDVAHIRQAFSRYFVNDPA